MIKKQFLIIGMVGAILAAIVIIAAASSSFQPNTSDEKTIDSNTNTPESLQTEFHPIFFSSSFREFQTCKLKP